MLVRLRPVGRGVANLMAGAFESDGGVGVVVTGSAEAGPSSGSDAGSVSGSGSAAGRELTLGLLMFWAF